MQSSWTRTARRRYWDCHDGRKEAQKGRHCDWSDRLDRVCFSEGISSSKSHVSTPSLVLCLSPLWTAYERKTAYRPTANTELLDYMGPLGMTGPYIFRRSTREG